MFKFVQRVFCILLMEISVTGKQRLLGLANIVVFGLFMQFAELATNPLDQSAGEPPLSFAVFFLLWGAGTLLYNIAIIIGRNSLLLSFMSWLSFGFMLICGALSHPPGPSIPNIYDFIALTSILYYMIANLYLFVVGAEQFTKMDIIPNSPGGSTNDSVTAG